LWAIIIFSSPYFFDMAVQGLSHSE
jgi:hypothetical protein